MSLEQFWIEGCKLTRHNLSASVCVGLIRFRGLFGVSPETCSLLWNKIPQHPEHATIVHLLYALLFLKCYAIEHLNRTITGVDEKSFRKWSWIYVNLLARINVVSCILLIFNGQQFKNVVLDSI
jgi:hypothetical protein